MVRTAEHEHARFYVSRRDAGPYGKREAGAEWVHEANHTARNNPMLAKSTIGKYYTF
jgi:hypothetical protein